MLYNIFNEVLTQPLAIEPSYIYAYAMMLQRLSAGNLIPEGTNFAAERAKLAAYTLSVQMGSAVRMSARGGLDDAPEGSIAVIQLKGPVVKNSQMCGPRGTLDIANDFNKARTNPNIIGAVFDVETGGGMALAVKPLADAMTAFRKEKPILGLGGDVVGSAGYYLMAYCTEIMAQHPLSIWGSIGAVMAFSDAKAKLEKEGIILHEVYATPSSNKNKTFNEALKGNYKPLIQNLLDPFANEFIADMKAERKGKIDESDELVYTGETFLATEAQTRGLIDSFGDMSAALNRVQELHEEGAHKISHSLNNIDMNFKNITALAGIETPTEEQIDLANADLTLAAITHVSLVSETFIQEATNATAQNTQLTADLAAANGNVTKLTGELSAANTTIADLQAKVDAFGANAGAQHQAPDGEDTQANEEEDDEEKILANLPHNRAADRMLNS